MEEHHLIEKKCEHLLVDLLIDFQFLEESLKEYLGTQFSLIKKLSEGMIPFNYSAKDLNNKTLGSLVITLSKYLDDDEHIKRLKDVVKHRNDIAHSAFAFIKKGENKEALPEKKAELSKIKRELDYLLEKQIILIVNQTASITKIALNKHGRN